MIRRDCPADQSGVITNIGETMNFRLPADHGKVVDQGVTGNLSVAKYSGVAKNHGPFKNFRLTTDHGVISNVSKAIHLGAIRNNCIVENNRFASNAGVFPNPAITLVRKVLCGSD